MIKNILGLFIVAIIFAACGSNATQDNTTQEESKELSTFGESITEEGSITYDELLNKLSTTDSLNTKVVGTVDEVCQTKGCWMTITSENSDHLMRVKFKDYGFFVPKDISGRKVVFEGKAFKEITSVADLKHYAEDAGKSEQEIDMITEPEASYSFLASGVLLIEE